MERYGVEWLQNVTIEKELAEEAIQKANEERTIA